MILILICFSNSYSLPTKTSSLRSQQTQPKLSIELWRKIMNLIRSSLLINIMIKEVDKNSRNIDKVLIMLFYNDTNTKLIARELQCQILSWFNKAKLYLNQVIFGIHLKRHGKKKFIEIKFKFRNNYIKNV